MKNFESANSDDPEGIIEASKVAFIKAMRDVITGLKGETKAPGLTWEQLEFILDGFENKKAIVIHQEHEF